MGHQLEVRVVQRNMKTLCLILSALTIVSQARPQYGGAGNNGRQPGGSFGQQTQVRPTARPPFLPQGCRLEYKIVYSVEEREEYENKCETRYRQECQNKFQRICNPYREKQCQTDYKRQCDTNWKQECNQLYKDVQQEYQTEECKDQEVRKCEKHWEEGTDGSKNWVDNPATCKTLRETNCYPVTKYKTVKEPYQKCDRVPYETCNDVPYENCNWVNREKCENAPYQDCNDVPWQDCKQVHKSVPHQVARRRPFRVCNNKDPYEFTDAEINQFDILEIRTVDSDEFDENDDVEEVDPKLLEETEEEEEKPQKQSSSAITFGQ